MGLTNFNFGIHLYRRHIALTCLRNCKLVCLRHWSPSKSFSETSALVAPTDRATARNLVFLSYLKKSEILRFFLTPQN